MQSTRTSSGRKHPSFLTCVLVIPLLTAIVGTLLLFAVSFIPNSWVWENALSSAYQLTDEGWPRNDVSIAGKLPFERSHAADPLSMETAYTLDRQHPENLFLKKINADSTVRNRYLRFVETVEVGAPVTESYSRYWMGFRLPIRLLLVVTAYYGMRILAAALDYLLLILACATTAKRGSVWTAIALAAAVGLLEPYAVIGSLGYSTCFLLCFLLLTVLNCAKLELGDEATLAVFCLFGALTQFFDFYTYPLIVFGLPVLVLVQRYRGTDSLRLAGRLFLGWMLSWLVMWLFNLAAVTLFTADNGIRDAIISVAGRFGIGEYRSAETSYSIPEAFHMLWAYLKLPRAGVLLPALAVMLAALYALAGRTGTREKLRTYLGICVLPLGWFAATPQPLIIHMSVQFRSVAVLYLALFLFALDALGLPGKNRLTRLLWRP